MADASRSNPSPVLRVLYIVGLTLTGILAISGLQPTDRVAPIDSYRVEGGLTLLVTVSVAPGADLNSLKISATESVHEVTLSCKYKEKKSVSAQHSYSKFADVRVALRQPLGTRVVVDDQGRTIEKVS